MKRTDWIISGFLAVLILAVSGGFLVFWLQARAESNRPIVTNAPSNNSTASSGISVVDAFALADERAKSWQPDAQIANATASIVRFEQVEDIYGGRTNWNIIYYSATTSSVATVVVTDQTATVLGTKTIDFVPPLADVAALKLNSGQAMTMAMANGAEVLFVGQAERVAHLTLEKTDEGRTEWQIVIQNETTGLRGIFRIDAVTGELIEKSGL